MKYVADQLQEGKTVTFNPRGNSMMPRIKSGQDVTVAPVDTKDVNVGDVVLCKVAGKIFLHLVKAIDNTKGFQIGNNKGPSTDGPEPFTVRQQTYESARVFGFRVGTMIMSRSIRWWHQPAKLVEVGSIPTRDSKFRGLPY